MEKKLYFWEDFKLNKLVNLGTYEFTEEEIIVFGKNLIHSTFI